MFKIEVAKTRRSNLPSAFAGSGKGFANVYDITKDGSLITRTYSKKEAEFTLKKLKRG